MKRKKLATAGNASKSSLAKKADDKKPDTAKPNPKSRLTASFIQKFAALASRGVPLDACCDYLEVNRGSFWAWQRKGEKYLEGNFEPASHKVFGDFVKALRKATASYRIELIDDLHTNRSTAGAWQGLMTILERRDRKSFGKREQAGGDDEQFDPDEKFL